MPWALLECELPALSHDAEPASPATAPGTVSLQCCLPGHLPCRETVPGAVAVLRAQLQSTALQSCAPCEGVFPLIGPFESLVLP